MGVPPDKGTLPLHQGEIPQGIWHSYEFRICQHQCLLGPYAACSLVCGLSVSTAPPHLTASRPSRAGNLEEEVDTPGGKRAGKRASKGAAKGGAAKAAEWEWDGADWVRRPTANWTQRLNISDVGPGRLTPSTRGAVRLARRAAALNMSLGLSTPRGAARLARRAAAFNMSLAAVEALGTARQARRAAIPLNSSFGRRQGGRDGARLRGGKQSGGEMRKQARLQPVPKCAGASVDSHARYKAASRQRLCLKDEMVAAHATARVPLLWSQELVASRPTFRNENPFATRKFQPYLSQLPPTANLSGLWSRGCDPCDTCAVVGASGSLLRYRHGPLIDAHEVVLRPNWLVTGPKYEARVGASAGIEPT